MNKITDRQTDDFFGEYERPRRFSIDSTLNPYGNFRRKIMLRKKDCFAYCRARCKILTEMVCKFGPCSFYKTVEQDKMDRKKYKLDTNYKQGGNSHEELHTEKK